METDSKWRALGYRHVTWELLRYYLAQKSENKQRELIDQLNSEKSLPAGGERFPISVEAISQFFNYVNQREKAFEAAFDRLRDEEKAKRYCVENKIAFSTTATQSKDHHQASKALVATVSAIAVDECAKRSIPIDKNPQARCVWCNSRGLHVTARNLDGAIPSTVNPVIIWEIKEYWGKTSGGSKMSDAVYECNLVGRELRDFEQQSGVAVLHAVFVDGKEQWSSRKSDLKRFIDLENQGLIDRLFIGTDVETKWRQYLSNVLDS